MYPDDKSLFRILNGTYSVRPGELLYIYLRKGALWLPARSAVAADASTPAKPAREQGFYLHRDASVDVSMEERGNLICQGAFINAKCMPERIYLTPFWDARKGNSIHNCFTYRVDQDAIESLYDIDTGILLYEGHPEPWESKTVCPVNDNPNRRYV